MKYRVGSVYSVTLSMKSVTIREEYSFRSSLKRGSSFNSTLRREEGKGSSKEGKIIANRGEGGQGRGRARRGKVGRGGCSH